MSFPSSGPFLSMVLCPYLVYLVVFFNALKILHQMFGARDKIFLNDQIDIIHHRYHNSSWVENQVAESRRCVIVAVFRFQGSPFQFPIFLYT